MKIILVVMDTLRADHLGCYGYHKNTSPFMDRFAAEGTLFEDAIPTDVPTQPSFTSLMTGVRGINNGVVTHSPLENIDDSVPLLQERLASSMTTAAVSTLYGMKKYFSRGFHYYMNPVAGNPSRLQLVQAEEINSFALSWLRTHYSDDFFLFVHYWDPHAPYLPPEKYRSLFYDGVYNDPNNHSLDQLKKSPLWQFHLQYNLVWLKELAGDLTDVNYIVAQYDAEIRHVDDAFKELMEELDSLGITDETMVVLTADHGESLGEHGFYFDHADVYQTTIHVPLIIRWPGHFPKKRVKGLVQNLDITTTILGAAGLSVKGMEGIDLREVAYGRSKPRDAAYSNQAVWTAKRTMIKELDHRYKVILTYDPTFWPTPPVELYDLTSDPDEKVNLADSRPDLLDSLELELRRWEDAQLKGRLDPLKKVTDMGVPAKKWVQNVAVTERSTYEEFRNKIDAPKRELVQNGQIPNHRYLPRTSPLHIGRGWTARFA
ncbi:MAG: sulfatase [Candidatus Marsarchaeota archaeon]